MLGFALSDGRLDGMQVFPVNVRRIFCRALYVEHLS